MTLYNIAESLILEVAGKSTIMDCMIQKRIAEVYYDDDEFNKWPVRLFQK